MQVKKNTNGRKNTSTQNTTTNQINIHFIFFFRIYFPHAGSAIHTLKIYECLRKDYKIVSQLVRPLFVKFKYSLSQIEKVLSDDRKDINLPTFNIYDSIDLWQKLRDFAFMHGIVTRKIIFSQPTRPSFAAHTSTNYLNR